jgi:hypothetical protein
MHVNATLLLDGRVLVTGGVRRGREEPILETELFNPRTETWSRGATCHVGRTYHSVAVLLPDGRVWTGGGNPKWGVDELRIEVYTPGYCSKGVRPVVGAPPPAVGYDALFDVPVRSAGRIVEAAFVRPSSVTHSFNVDQRWIGLRIESMVPGKLVVRSPPTPKIAPPGHYMLSVLDEHGCPSVAEWVHVA